MVMKARLYLVPPMPAHRGRSETERHYARMEEESRPRAFKLVGATGRVEAVYCSECRDYRATPHMEHYYPNESGSVRLATIGFAILGCLIFTTLAFYGARNATPKASDHYHAVKAPVVVPGVSPARVVALVNNGLHACQSAHMVDCHAEIDSDGSVGVYGSKAPTGEAYGSRPIPACQEDDPCWNCQTMGNRICGPGATLPKGIMSR